MGLGSRGRHLAVDRELIFQELTSRCGMRDGKGQSGCRFWQQRDMQHLGAGRRGKPRLVCGHPLEKRCKAPRKGKDWSWGGGGREELGSTQI